jgi:hypothetical protein
MKEAQFMRKIGIAAFYLFFISLTHSSLAWAAAGTASGRFFVGPDLGYGILSAGEGTHLDWGINLGSRYYPPWILGIFYDYIPLGGVSSPGGVSVSGSEKFWGFQLAYDFTPSLMGFSLGARVAMSSFDTQTVVPGQKEDDETRTGFAWGPVISYERPISSSLTSGVMAYIMLPSEASANNVVGLLATLKFWFF